MSTFQRRYTDRQKRAVGIAQIDGGMTARDAASALMAGSLIDADGPVPPPADAMPKTTAQDCARRIRLEREGRRGGLETRSSDVVRAELSRRLITAADRLTRRLERKALTGTADAQLAETLTKAARAVHAVNVALRSAEEQPPPSPTNGKPAETAKPQAAPLDVIGAQIAADERKAAAAH